MPLTVKDWRDDPDHTTPLTAAALEDMETRLGAYTDTQVTALVRYGAGLTLPPWRVGSFYSSVGVGVPGAGTMLITQTDWVPLFIPPSGSRTIDQLAVNVTTLAAASAVRLLAYADDGGNYPAALLQNFGTVPSTATGVQTLTLGTPYVFPAAGLYWLAARAEGGGPAVSRTPLLHLGHMATAAAALGTGQAGGYFISTTAAVPDPAPASLNPFNSLTRIVVRAA